MMDSAMLSGFAISRHKSSMAVHSNNTVFEIFCTVSEYGYLSNGSDMSAKIVENDTSTLSSDIGIDDGGQVVGVVGHCGTVDIYFLRIEWLYE
jgi:hypothetical protein